MIHAVVNKAMRSEMRMKIVSVLRLSVGMACVGTLFLATGCATHSRNAELAIERLKMGDTPAALKWSENLKKSVFSKDLGCLECGRIQMLAGDFTGSRTNFSTVIDKIIENTEAGPSIRMGSVGSTLAASTITDDTLRKYDLPAYEVIQLLHYQTLNYLLTGDQEAANVEMRRTVFAQDAIADKYAKEVERAKKEDESAKAKDAATTNRTPQSVSQSNTMAVLESKMDTMRPVLERTRSSCENGLTWYFCGLMYEKQKDAANAAICYRKASELVPRNSCIQKDCARLLSSQDVLAFSNYVSRCNMDPKSLARDSTEIVVLYEEALVAPRQAVKIPIPVPGGIGTMTLVAADFPVYNNLSPSLVPLVLMDGKKDLGATEPAGFLQSLACRDLKEKIPGIVVRNVSRAVTKVVAQQVVNQNGNDGFKLAMMLFSVVSSLASTADTRAWYSIPKATHLFRGSLSPGMHTLLCRNSGTGAEIAVPVTITGGETRLIWIADTGGIAVVATAPLAGKGLPPTYQQFNNRFSTNGVASSLSCTATVSTKTSLDK